MDGELYHVAERGCWRRCLARYEDKVKRGCLARDAVVRMRQSADGRLRFRNSPWLFF